MTHRLLLVVALFHPVGALAQDQPDVLERPYDQVVELPLDASTLSDVPPVALDDPAVRSAVTLESANAEGDVPALAPYEAAVTNAQRSQPLPAPEGVPLEADPRPAVLTMDDPSQPEAVLPTEPKPAGKATVLAAPASASGAVPAAVVTEDTPGDAPMAVALPLAIPQPVEPPVAAPAPPHAAPFHAPGSRPPRSGSTNDVPQTPSAKKERSGATPRREAREDRDRSLSTVFGSRRGPRLLGAYASVATQAPGFGGPASAAGQLGVILGGTFRFGLELRGLRYGNQGPDVQLASTGWLMGLTFNQRKLVHPVFDVVFGGGIVSRRDGPVYGSVGTSVIRGGAELNLTRSIRLTATLGWSGIASPNPSVRTDLNGLEAAIGVRVGWF